MVFVSISLRVKIDVEAANMVESVGNYSRHRIIPMITQNYDEDGNIKYDLTYLTGISGQSLGNIFSRALADIVISRNHPICDSCKNYEEIGGFPKRPVMADNDSIDKRVCECVIEDVTGFMATKEQKGGGEKGAVIRRTSKIWFSYMIPDADAIKHSPPIPQFHVRYGRREEEQNIYTIESASAIYRFMIGIDVDGIGKLTNDKCVKDRNERIKDVFDALIQMFNGYFGAKKARYLPQMEFLGGIAAISHPYRFMVSSAKVKLTKEGKLIPWYLIDTLERAEQFMNAVNDSKTSQVIHLIYFDNEFNTKLQPKGNIQVTDAKNFENLIRQIKETILNSNLLSKCTTVDCNELLKEM